MRQKLLIICILALLVLISASYIYSKNALPGETEHNDVIITMARGRCYGTCPEYSLAVYGNGTVFYEGIYGTKIIGMQSSEIPLEDIEKLVDEFYKINYFSLKDSYREYKVTDLSTITTSIKINGKTKTVLHYRGDPAAPEELTKLENKIDEIVNSAQWTN